MPNLNAPAAVPLKARIATQCHFFICGMLFATWGVHVPTVKAQYGLSDAALSWLMLAAGVGALIGLSQVGKWVARHGARKVVLATGLLMCAPLAVLLLMPGYFSLLAALFCYGLFNGSFDVAMNAEAVAVEHAYKRPIMSSFHGFFSAGGMAGALVASAIAAIDVAPIYHLAGGAIVGFVLIALASAWMMPVEATHSPEEAAKEGFRLPHGTILLLGVMAALGMVGEGAMYDWSTLYMRDVLGSPQQVAALAYGTFSAAMAIGRFGGDWARARMGSSAILQLTSWLSAIAMTASLAIGNPWAALIGFSLVGIGFSNMVPVLFSAAARVPGVTPANGIAGVSAVGYVGFMMGPPMIGGIAHGSSLSLALLVVAVFAVAIALLSRSAMRQIAEPASDAGLCAAETSS